MPARRLRSYEQQGLLSSARSANGYRDYDPRSAERVAQIRGLIDAGIPTAIIRDILPLLGRPGTIHVTGAATELIAALEQHREQLDARIACISRNRDAIAEYLETIRSGTGPPGSLDRGL